MASIWEDKEMKICIDIDTSMSKRTTLYLALVLGLVVVAGVAAVYLDPSVATQTTEASGDTLVVGGKSIPESSGAVIMSAPSLNGS